MKSAQPIKVKMGPNLVDITPHQTDLEPAPKDSPDEAQTLKPVTHSAQSGDIYLTATPSPIHLNHLGIIHK